MARDGDSAEGRKHAAKALSLDPANAIAAAALATMQIEAGEAADAKLLLEPLANALPDVSADRSLLLSLLGDACSRTGDYAAAYDYYARSKQDFAAIYADRFADRPSHREYLDGIGKQLAAMPIAAPITRSPRQCRRQASVSAWLSAIRQHSGREYPRLAARCRGAGGTADFG